ncbi:hypothetical protein [Pseudoalteromonas obscura]|uniref:MarR family transcriptional regulator n=1 Tax=Pseudoalteromonas obscura TaxID=3048491 RepID=A0ABT7EU99_9GAMM|nr:hypothetical protein [Pseudoalteromonas sp. P94(2023)]MDK2598635.1 hypothetical protein [Pseudoalteromonas sp. P94(2023)]
MSNEQYLSPQVQRTLKAIELMAGHEVYGIEPKKLAKLVGCSGSDLTRVLANLEHQGWAEKLTTNTQRWRLNKKPVHICNTVSHNFTSAIRDLQLEQTKYNGVTS